MELGGFHVKARLQFWHVPGLDIIVAVCYFNILDVLWFRVCTFQQSNIIIYLVILCECEMDD